MTSTRVTGRSVRRCAGRTRSPVARRERRLYRLLLSGVAGGLGAMRADESGELIDLREVVIEHRAQIFRLARSLTHSNADAEDLAQTALVRALQQGPLSCSAEQAKWYVLRIVRNLAIDQARARARVTVEPCADVPDLAGSRAPARRDRRPRRRRPGAARSPRRARAPAPRGAAAALPRRARLRQGGRALDVTEHAARQRVYRALQALRAAVKLRPTAGLDDRSGAARREDRASRQPASSARAPISTDGWRRRASARASI